ncbi:hypothetical protein [Leuconostoc lactis]|uniref:hypothetical protein n=1 Tax=Leuconostoc lactis TaxID=1246 RepID=UPI00265D0246|nr:hypothetical protein [Leuconostoc lactis]
MDKRNSNIEVMRILMVLITAHHLAIWGFFKNSSVTSISPNIVWLQLLESVGKIGVDIFILITGYFSLNSIPTLKKVLNLTNRVRLYSLIMFITVLMVGTTTKFSIGLFIKSLFPTIWSMYWFITAYVIIYIFSGFLSKGFQKMTQEQANNWTSTVTELLPAFFLGIYLRNFKLSQGYIRILNILTLVSIIIGLGIIFIGDSIGSILSNAKLIELAARPFYIGSSPLAMIIATYIFIRVLSVEKQTNNFVNRVSSSALAIYLIQDYAPFRNILWNDIFKISKLVFDMNFLFLVVYSLVAVVAIVVLAIIIDQILTYIFNVPLQLLLKLELWIINKFGQLIKIQKWNRKNEQAQNP